MAICLLPTVALASAGRQTEAVSSAANGFRAEGISAFKAVTNAENITATGNDESPYVSIAGAGAKVYYTLRIDNSTDTSQDVSASSLVIIDELPRATDDTGVLFRTDRGSQFSVLFGEAPEMSVYKVSGGSQIAISKDEYTVRYGNSVGKLDPTYDWSCSESDCCISWGKESNGKNAVRIAFNPDFSLAPGETILVSFSAYAGDDADPGETAWNSFAYSCELQTDGDIARKTMAEPLRVGIRVPGAKINVTKKVGGDPAYAGMLYTFLLKQNGTPLSDVKYTLYGSDAEYRTSSDGSFKLAAEEKAILSVAPGSNYTVEETDLPKYFTVQMAAVSPGDGTATENEFRCKQLDDNSTVGVYFTNSYEAPMVDAVTVSPAAVNVAKGSTRQFLATVKGVIDIEQTVIWTVEGGISGTTIDQNGTLTVAEDETAATLTVRATSMVNITKSGTATVTVLTPTFPIILPIDTGYTVAAEGTSTSPVEKGGSYSFKVTLDNNHEKGASFAVKANDAVLTPSGDIYTISNITSTQTVTVEGIVMKNADYTTVDTAIGKIPDDLSLYTAETAKAVNDAKNAVERGKKIDEQETVNGYATAINDAVAALTYKGADYSAVDAAIASIPDDLSVYTEETIKAVNNAKAAVDRNKNITEQAIVNGYATAINNAVAALTYKGADYSAVDAALGTIPTDLSSYTDETAKAVTDAKDAVIRGKNINEQATVDGYTTAINNAVSSLEKKKVEPESPQTGDNSNMALWIALLFISGSAVTVLGISQKRKKAK